MANKNTNSNSSSKTSSFARILALALSALVATSALTGIVSFFINLFS